MTIAVQKLSTFDPNSLLKHSQKELDELFQTLPSLKKGELNGVYRGRLFAIMGLGILPRFLRNLLYRLLQTFINPWKGKRFDGDNGANIWFSKKGTLPYGYYTINSQDSAVDGEPVTHLSYDVDKNLRLLRPVRGETRKLSDGVYLARMNYQTRKKLVRVLYFTLDNIS